MCRIRLVAWFCASLLALLQVSCNVSSESPLSDPDAAKLDERLFGQWRAVKEEKDQDTEFWFIGRPRGELKNAPTGLMVARDISISQANEISADEFPSYFFVTKIGNNHYLNIVRNGPKREPCEWKKDDARIYFFMKYTVTENKLTAWMIDPELTAKAVTAGKIKGQVKMRIDKNGKADGIEQVTLKDTTANTAKFIDQANPPIFTKKPLVLERVK